MTTEVDAPDVSIGPSVGGIFDAVADAQWAVGFDAGYRRAVNNLLADVALIVAEVGRELPGDDVNGRAALRHLRARLERHLDGESDSGRARATASDGYVDGGLGI